MARATQAQLLELARSAIERARGAELEIPDELLERIERLAGGKIAT